LQRRIRTHTEPHLQEVGRLRQRWHNRMQ
jgi:hypothetical protein